MSQGSLRYLGLDFSFYKSNILSFKTWSICVYKFLFGILNKQQYLVNNTESFNSPWETICFFSCFLVQNCFMSFEQISSWSMFHKFNSFSPSTAFITLPSKLSSVQQSHTRTHTLQTKKCILVFRNHFCTTHQKFRTICWKAAGLCFSEAHET